MIIKKHIIKYHLTNSILMIIKNILIIIMRTCEQGINNEVDPVGGISTTTAFVEAAFVDLVNIL